MSVLPPITELSESDGDAPAGPAAKAKPKVLPKKKIVPTHPVAAEESAVRPKPNPKGKSHKPDGKAKAKNKSKAAPKKSKK